MDGVVKKRCTRCGMLKPLDQYSYKSTGKHQKMSECMACNAERVRVYRQRVKAAAGVPLPEPVGHYPTVEERELCLPQGMTGRVVGHYVNGKIVYIRGR